MTETFVEDDILIEWVVRPGIEQVGIFDRKKQR